LFSKELIRTIEPQLRAIVRKNGFDSFLEFQSLLYNLAISRDQQCLTDVGFQLQNDFHNSKQIETLYNYVKDNYDQNLKLEYAAQMMNMSVASFCRFIKKRTGKTFVDFVISHKIGIAAQELLETNKSISEICFESGFNNISNFNRIFKKKQGCTPGDYRKNIIGTSHVH